MLDQSRDNSGPAIRYTRNTVNVLNKTMTDYSRSLELYLSGEVKAEEIVQKRARNAKTRASSGRNYVPKAEICTLAKSLLGSIGDIGWLRTEGPDEYMIEVDFDGSSKRARFTKEVDSEINYTQIKGLVEQLEKIYNSIPKEEIR